MERVAEQEFAEEQMCFRKRVGTRDQIFNLRVLMEKARENNVQLFMAFIDYKKAFDSVRHQTLWKVMETMGVSRHLVQLLSNLYRDQQAAVRVEEDLTEWFEVKKGVRQGCLLSPMCFNFYSEAVMRESVEEQPTIGVNVSGRNINNLRFADDIALIATSPEGLQELLDSTDSTSSEYQLEISTKKTKVMAVAKEPTQVTATCRGEQLQQVPRFKYLGSTLEQTASCSHEINIRLGAARAALRSLDVIWKDRALKTATKLKVLRTLVWPVVTYGCEAWTLHARDIRKIQALEMKCYRKILRISWTEHRTNDSVLEELGVGRTLLNIIKRRKLQYFGHVTRAGNITTHILQGTINGRRSRGRPRRRWGDDIREWTGLSLAECTHRARDRRKWRRLILEATMVPDPQA